jgi:GNAT superfamily N-acetyltransferase
MDARASNEPNGSVAEAQPAEPVEFRAMRPADVPRVSELILRVFNEDVAPDFDAQGVEAFARYADPEALLHRSEHGHIVIVASVQGCIVGVIEFREPHHISLLFVDGGHRRKGIARGLFSRALQAVLSSGRRVVEVTVNSSPFAVDAYRRLGFTPTGPEQTTNGIRNTPMVLTLANEM